MSKDDVLKQAKTLLRDSLLDNLLDDVSRLRSTPRVWIELPDSLVNSVFGNEDSGLPSGRIVEIYGAESHGKTALLYWLLGWVQKRGGVAVLADSESTLDLRWAKRLGVNANDLLLLQLEEGYQDSETNKWVPAEGMEDLFEHMQKVVDSSHADLDVPVIIGWDSLPGTLTRRELAGDYGESPIAERASVLSRCVPKLATYLASSPVTLVYINQLRTSINPWASFADTPGGRALKFFTSVRIKVTRVAKRQAGIICKCVNIKNRLGTPHKEASFNLDFSKGFRWIKTRTKKR